MINYQHQLFIEISKLLRLEADLMLRVENYSVPKFCTFTLTSGKYESKCTVNSKEHLDNPKHLTKQLVKKLAYAMFME